MIYSNNMEYDAMAALCQFEAARAMPLSLYPGWSRDNRVREWYSTFLLVPAVHYRSLFSFSSEYAPEHKGSYVNIIAAQPCSGPPNTMRRCRGALLLKGCGAILMVKAR